jgi:hypothetical protein
MSMSVLWGIYDRISDVFGPGPTAIGLVIVVAVGCYFALGAARPST